MIVKAKPEQIRLFAAKGNLADYEVAAKIGLTRQQFSKVLSGSSSLRPAARRSLLRVLAADFDDVFQIVDRRDERAHA